MNPHHTAWHADDEDLAGYAAGAASPVLAASLESHLMGCALCRHRLGTVSASDDRELAWSRLADTIDRPSTRFGLVRTALATPAMVQAALVGVLVLGVVPLLTAAAVGDGGLVALLLAAPLAPVGAVALAYRDQTDPAGELSLATPAAGLRLVALRAFVISCLALPVAFLALAAVELWFVDVPVRLAFAWCLPGLALSAVVLLAGTTRLDPTHVAVAASTGWTALVATAVVVGRRLEPSALAETIAQPGAQYAALAIAVAALVLTYARRDTVDYRRIG